MHASETKVYIYQHNKTITTGKPETNLILITSSKDLPETDFRCLILIKKQLISTSFLIDFLSEATIPFRIDFWRGN